MESKPAAAAPPAKRAKTSAKKGAARPRPPPLHLPARAKDLDDEEEDEEPNTTYPMPFNKQWLRHLPAKDRDVWAEVIVTTLSKFVDEFARHMSVEGNIAQYEMLWEEMAGELDHQIKTAQKKARGEST